MVKVESEIEMPNGHKRYAARHGKSSIFDEEMTWTPTREVSDDDLSPQDDTANQRHSSDACCDKYGKARIKQPTSTSEVTEVGEQKEDGKQTSV